MEPRRIRFFALALAIVAVALAAIAVGVVAGRNGRNDPAPSTGSAAPSPVALQTVAVTAVDVAAIEAHVEREPDGMQVMDLPLAKRLGLEPGDVITSISGHMLKREFDVRMAILQIGRISTAYIEVTRGSANVLLRWRIDGDLYAARDYNRPSSLLYGSGSGSNYAPPPPPPPPPPDPMVDAWIATIEKIDDTHYRIPRKTVDAIVLDPMKVATSARVVPALHNGRPDGFKLYAIWPSSLYAHLGLNNGDTIQTANGLPVTTPSEALEAYTKLRNASAIQVGLVRRGQPMTLTITIK
jgi:hypothetical protein